MSTTPIICLANEAEPHRFVVTTVTADLRCTSCGSTDLDLDEAAMSTTATSDTCEQCGDTLGDEKTKTIEIDGITYTIHATCLSDATDEHPTAKVVASKTATGIDWQGDTHMGVSYVTGRAPNGDVYEIYYNPNSNPTPYSWVRYGPDGDTGPNSVLDAGRGFTTAQEAFVAADVHFQSLGSKRAFNDPEMDEVKDTSSVSQKVTCSSCLTDHVVTAVDPAQPMPPCPSCGRETLSPAGGTLASRRTAGTGTTWAVVSPGTATPLWNKTFDSKAEAEAFFAPLKGRTDDLVPKNLASYEVAEVTLNGPDWVRVGSLDAAFAALTKQAEEESVCKNCGGEIRKADGPDGAWKHVGETECAKAAPGERAPAFAARAEAKINQIADGIQATNPGMNRAAALAVAGKTLTAYPAMIEGN